MEDPTIRNSIWFVDDFEAVVIVEVISGCPNLKLSKLEYGRKVNAT